MSDFLTNLRAKVFKGPAAPLPEPPATDVMARLSAVRPTPRGERLASHRDRRPMHEDADTTRLWVALLYDSATLLDMRASAARIRHHAAPMRRLREERLLWRSRALHPHVNAAWAAEADCAALVDALSGVVANSCTVEGEPGMLDSGESRRAAVALELLARFGAVEVMVRENGRVLACWAEAPLP